MATAYGKNQSFEIDVKSVFGNNIRLILTHKVDGKPDVVRNLSSKDGGIVWLDNDTGRTVDYFIPTRTISKAIADFRHTQTYVRSLNIPNHRPYVSRPGNHLILIEGPLPFYMTKYVSRATPRVSTSAHTIAQNSRADVGVLDDKIIIYHKDYLRSHERGDEIKPFPDFNSAADYVEEKFGRVYPRFKS